MPLTEDNAHDFWNQRYLERHTPWDRGGVNPALSDWLETGALSPPATVLVPGCGRGHEVIALARWGFHVTAVDLSPLALEALRARLDAEGLAAALVQADLLEWDARTAFDIVYEQTCLCALLPRRWPEYEARLHGWLKPGGLLAALFMQSDKHHDPPFHCALPEMQALFDRRRWTWPQQAPRHVPHPAGVAEYAVILRRAGPD